MSRISHCFDKAYNISLNETLRLYNENAGISSDTYTKCYLQCVLVFGCYVEFILLTYMTFKEVNKQHNSMNKIIISLLCSIFMLNSGSHYLFYPTGFIRTVSTILMEIFRLIILFSIYNYFADDLMKVLKHAEKWRWGLKILLAINLIWC